VWLIREAIYLATGHAAEMPLGEAVGGLYWFFTVTLPGFVQFRYPAKLLVLATLCAAVLAGRGVDRAIGSRWLWAGAIAVALVCTHSLLSLIVFRAAFDEGLGRIAWFNGQHNMHFGLHNDSFGPLDQVGARWDLMGSFIQALVVSLLVAALGLVLARTERQSGGNQLLAVALLLVTAFDLSIAHAWGVITVSTAVSSQVRDLQRPRPDPSQHEGDHRPDVKVRDDQWRWARSPDRMTAIVAEDVAHQKAKYNLLAGMRNLYSRGSAGYADAWSRWEQPFQDLNACAVSEDEPSILAPLRVEYPGALARRTDNVAMLARPHRQYFVYENCAVWVWGVVIETDAQPAFCATAGRATIDHPGRQSRLSIGPWHPFIDLEYDYVFWEPSQWTVDFLPDEAGYEAALARAAWLVFPEQYDPDFVCEVTDLVTGEKSQTPIYRAQRVLRGIHLPAGRFEVRFFYRPWSFYLGAAVSLLAWPFAGWLAWKQWRATGGQGEEGQGECLARGDSAGQRSAAGG
jgi:hypothetical protein